MHYQQRSKTLVAYIFTQINIPKQKYIKFAKIKIKSLSLYPKINY
jgi:hypothetical protein